MINRKGSISVAQCVNAVWTRGCGPAEGPSLVGSERGSVNKLIKGSNVVATLRVSVTSTMLPLIDTITKPIE